MRSLPLEMFGRLRSMAGCVRRVAAGAQLSLFIVQETISRAADSPVTLSSPLPPRHKGEANTQVVWKNAFRFAVVTVGMRQGEKKGEREDFFLKNESEKKGKHRKFLQQSATHFSSSSPGKV